MTGKTKKVLNVLEFMSALILLADFGESSGDDLQHNAELIEHKINLLLLLFDLRKQTSMNISEVIIMLRTAMQSQSKVFPSVLFFRSQAVLNEIKDAMMGLFRDRLDAGVNDLLGARKTTKEDDIAKLREKELSDKAFLGFVKKQHEQTGEKLSSGFYEMSTLSTNVSESEEEQKFQMSTPSGFSAMQAHIHESLEEKKRRLFRWNNYEKIQLPLDLIKDQLLQCNNVIKFLSVLNKNDFNKITLVWGSNKNLNQGLHIQKNFENYYKLQKDTEVHGSLSDKAVRDLVNLSKKQAKDNDDLLVFQTLLQKWQDSLSVQRSNTEDLQKSLMKKKRSY